MTIKELRKALENIPDDCKVVLRLVDDQHAPSMIWIHRADVYIDDPALKMLAKKDVSFWVKRAHHYDDKSKNIVEIRMLFSDY